MPLPGRRLVSAIAIVLVTSTGVTAASPAASAQPIRSDASPEYMIKAAYLLNFARLIEWPRDAFSSVDSPITIGVVGADPFGQALEQTVQGKTINQRRIAVHRLQWNQDVRGCQILFVSSTDSSRISELANRVAGLPVLIVGEASQPAARSATINFTIEDDRVRFEVNVGAAKRARLNVSSQILRVAKIVKEQ
jgi:hypothetical protein